MKLIDKDSIKMGSLSHPKKNKENSQIINFKKQNYAVSEYQ